MYIYKKVNFSNYVTKSDLKNAAGVDTSDFAKKVDLANLKSDIDELNIDKLKTLHVDLYKLSDVVEKKCVKKTAYDELVKKVKATKSAEISDLVKKADFNRKKKDEIEKEKKIIDHDKYITTSEFLDFTLFSLQREECKINTPAPSVKLFQKSQKL